MESTTIQSRVIKLENTRWKDLKFLQDADFKQWVDKGDEKLLASILKYQFIDPFKVWEHEGVLYCLDGEHRYSDLVYGEAINHSIPELLPETFFQLKTMAIYAKHINCHQSACSPSRNRTWI